MNLEKLYEDFRKNAIVSSLSFLNGDSKTNKSSTKKMNTAFKTIQANTKEMQQFYDLMMKDDNAYVKLKAITYCGNTKFNVDWAISQIKKLRKNKDLTDADRLAIDYAIDRWENESKE